MVLVVFFPLLFLLAVAVGAELSSASPPEPPELPVADGAEDAAPVAVLEGAAGAAGAASPPAPPSKLRVFPDFPTTAAMTAPLPSKSYWYSTVDNVPAGTVFVPAPQTLSFSTAPPVSTVKSGLVVPSKTLDSTSTSAPCRTLMPSVVASKYEL